MREAEIAYDSVIVRFGSEIGVKSKPVRLRYERLVAKHVRKALKVHSIPFDRIEHSFGRLYVRTPEAEEASKVISCVFGVSSTSPALSTSSSLEDIVDRGLEVARSVLEPASTFAVRCRRVGQHPYTSMDVCRLLGERILAELGHMGLKVNLEAPDKTVFVEVRDEEAYIYTAIREGVGGYPLGVQGKVIGLLSGGIDSPVACWLAMRRGCLVVPVHFDIRPFTDDRLIEKALELARILSGWSLGAIKHLYVVPFGQILEQIKASCPEKLTCVLCKRLMYRIAEQLALREGADGLVTGDAIGEQASQTLKNMKVIDAALTSLPVHRPLLCFDKAETVRLARRIGTYDISSEPDAGCSAVPKKPTTAAGLREVLEAERALDVEGLVRDALSRAERKKVEGPLPFPKGY